MKISLGRAWLCQVVAGTCSVVNSFLSRYNVARILPPWTSQRRWQFEPRSHEGTED